VKLVIDSGCDVVVVDLTDKTGALLEALQSARRFTRSYGDGPTYKPSGTAEKPESIDLQIVPDEVFGEPTPAIDELAQTVKASEKRWLEEYQKRTALEEELGQIKKRLAGVTAPEEE